MTMSETYEKKPSVVACELDGGSVLLDLDTSRYFGLNTVGLVVWEHLSMPQTIGQLCKIVETTFDVSEDICRPDLEQLMAQLLERKLVTSQVGSAV